MMISRLVSKKSRAINFKSSKEFIELYPIKKIFLNLFKALKCVETTGVPHAIDSNTVNGISIHPCGSVTREKISI